MTRFGRSAAKAFVAGLMGGLVGCDAAAIAAWHSTDGQAGMAVPAAFVELGSLVGVITFVIAWWRDRGSAGSGVSSAAVTLLVVVVLVSWIAWLSAMM